MSDGDSVSSALKDLGKETVKQAVNLPKTFIKGATAQVVNRDSDEDEAKKKAEKVATFQRIKEIEAEMAQIRAQNEKKQGPEIVSKSQDMAETVSNKSIKVDEASRQALGRAEQGRNFKG